MKRLWILVNTGWWSSSKKACNTECGFGGVGPLSCDKDPLAAETFVKPSSGSSGRGLDTKLGCRNEMDGT